MLYIVHFCSLDNNISLGQVSHRFCWICADHYFHWIGIIKVSHSSTQVRLGRQPISPSTVSFLCNLCIAALKISLIYFMHQPTCLILSSSWRTTPFRLWKYCLSMMRRMFWQIFPLPWFSKPFLLPSHPPASECHLLHALGKISEPSLATRSWILCWKQVIILSQSFSWWGLWLSFACHQASFSIAPYRALCHLFYKVQRLK